MTYEEAINHIKKHNEAHQRTEHFAVYITEALNMAIQALEKQIRKKPIPITRNEHSNKIIGYGCPNCHKDIVGSGFYCWSCGQAIDWSEEK